MCGRWPMICLGSWNTLATKHTLSVLGLPGRGCGERGRLGLPALARSATPTSCSTTSNGKESMCKVEAPVRCARVQFETTQVKWCLPPQYTNPAEPGTKWNCMYFTLGRRVIANDSAHATAASPVAACRCRWRWSADYQKQYRGSSSLLCGCQDGDEIQLLKLLLAAEPNDVWPQPAIAAASQHLQQISVSSWCMLNAEVSHAVQSMP